MSKNFANIDFGHLFDCVGKAYLSLTDHWHFARKRSNKYTKISE